MADLERKEHWEVLLNDYFDSLFGVAVHVWGKMDCALFSAGAVEAMTGVDLMAEFRGRYSDEAGAMAVIRKAGYPNLAALLDSRLPMQSRPFARRGDLVMDRAGNLAVVWGEVALAIGEEADTGREGIVRVPRENWRKAWKIG